MSRQRSPLLMVMSGSVEPGGGTKASPKYYRREPRPILDAENGQGKKITLAASGFRPAGARAEENYRGKPDWGPPLPPGSARNRLGSALSEKGFTRGYHWTVLRTP